MVKLVVQKRKARMGRNPATGEAIKIPGQDRGQGPHRQAAQGRGPAEEVGRQGACDGAASPPRGLERSLAARRVSLAPGAFDGSFRHGQSPLESRRAISRMSEPAHLELQRAERDAERARRRRHVPLRRVSSARTMKLRSNVATALVEQVLARRARRCSSCATWNSHGRSSSVIHGLSETATSRSIRFSSSRMLPGHQ